MVLLFSDKEKRYENVGIPMIVYPFHLLEKCKTRGIAFPGGGLDAGGVECMHVRTRMRDHAGAPFGDRETHRFGPSCVSPNVSSISVHPTPFDGVARQDAVWDRIGRSY